jgi:hypothetical protein
MQMTDVEQKVLNGWIAAMPGINIKPETHLEMIQESIVKTAYHESGHVAVNAFLGVHGLSHFEGATIIPNQDNLGKVTHSRIFPLTRSLGFPERLLQIQGRTRIMVDLAGRVAVNEAGYDYDLSFDDLFDWDFSGCETEEEWRRSTDEGRALEIAELLSSKTWPPFRILNMLEKWTHELIEIPAVWDVIEAIAHRLIVEGELNYDQHYELVEPIVYQWLKYPIWKRRLEFNMKKWMEQIPPVMDHGDEETKG